MEKEMLTRVQVNMQQGLLVNKNKFIVGMYDFHNKLIYLQVPYKKSDFYIPDSMKDFEIKSAGHISLTPYIG